MNSTEHNRLAIIVISENYSFIREEGIAGVSWLHGSAVIPLQIELEPGVLFLIFFSIA